MSVDPKGVASPRQKRSFGEWLLALWLAGCAGPGPDFGGPLPVRTQAHAELQVLDLGPRRAEAVPAGRVEARAHLFWTNTVLAGRPGDGEPFLFDLEMLRLSFPLRFGLGCGLDLEVEPGLLRSGAGILDGPIDLWHKTFGFPEGFRPQVPKDAYSAYVERDGSQVLELDPNRVFLTDLPLVLSGQILGAHPWLPCLLARAGVELPLGDSGAGAGNGGWDIGGGLVATRRVGSLELSGDLSWVLPATPAKVRRSGLSYDQRWSAGLGAELPIAPGLAALVQLRTHQSVLGNFQADRLNGSQLLLWCGARLALGRGLHLEASVGEDLIQKVSPDVSFHMGLGGRF